MNFEVSDVCMNISCKRNIYVNEDICLDVQNTVVLYENETNTFSYDVEAIDLIAIYVKGKKFVYESFGEVKSYIKLIYNINIDDIIKNEEYSEEEAGYVGEFIAEKYENVLKIM